MGVATSISAPPSEAGLLEGVAALLRQRLPEGWRLELEAGGGDPRVDGVWKLRAPDGAAVRILVEAKPQLATRDVGPVLERLAAARAAIGGQQPVALMLASRYLAPQTQQRIQRDGGAYADLTGNMRLALELPALFLRDVGAHSDPWRGPGRPRGSLKGAAPARVVRALVDFKPPVSVPQLAARSGASIGATYRVVDLLEREELVEREPRGPIATVAWRALIERWSRDYDFQRSNDLLSCLQPRGLPALLDALRTQKTLRYALTGALAIEDELSYAPPRLAMLYVENPEQAIPLLDLRPVETAANVLLARPLSDVSFDRLQQINGLRAAAKSQIAADLLTSAGRGPSEAQALLDWMQANQDAWREQ
ncbi:MAG: type IV toxin-antitoxin system AbiEi family antitoxin [Solirubrobacteraceae bacterium]